MADTELPNLTDFQQWEAAPETQETTETAAEEAEAKTASASEPKQTETETEKESEDDEELPKGLKKRFRKLTGKIRDLEAQLAQKPAAEAKPETAKPEVKTAPATPPGKPQLANFETYEDFVEALTDWKAEQREVKAKQTEAAKQNQTEWEKKIEAAKAKHEDWDDVVNDAVDVPVTAHMQQTIFEMENGPDVVHYLAKHPDEAKRIAKLSPLSQARELGKIEDKLGADVEHTAKKPAVSQAPRPPKTVSGSSGNDLGKEPDPSDFAKWSKWKDRQERAANGE